jgi:hypothetical protein
MESPKDIIWKMRLRSDYMEYFLHIGSYYEREFHLWVHSEEYLKDNTGKLARKTEEFLRMKGEI